MQDDTPIVTSGEDEQQHGRTDCVGWIGRLHRSVDAKLEIKAAVSNFWPSHVSPISNLRGPRHCRLSLFSMHASFVQ